MSGVSEATAVMTSRELFTVAPTAVNPPGQAPTPVASQPQLEQQRAMPFATTASYGQVGSTPPQYQSISAGTGMINQAPSTDQKRKRGRPRKYGSDGNMGISMASPPQPINVSVTQMQPQTFSPPSGAPQLIQAEPQVGGSASPTVKKPRGRPRGSSNKKQQKEILGSTGIGFIPHVLNVTVGEDVSSKIMAISQNGPRAVCVLSATGAISNVALRQAATSGGTATYEGHFDILSLCGSFMPSEVAGQRSRTGGLSIALLGPDGRVFGGCVAGMLVAASPIRVVAGSFLPDGRRETRANNVEPSTAAPKVNVGGAAGASSSPSRGTFSGSSGGPASPLNLSSGVVQGMSGMPWK